jgi:hypothetical protein
MFDIVKSCSRSYRWPVSIYGLDFIITASLRDDGSVCKSCRTYISLGGQVEIILCFDKVLVRLVLDWISFMLQELSTIRLIAICH